MSMSELNQPVRPMSDGGRGSRPIVITFDGSYVRAAAAMLRSLAKVRAGKSTTVVALVDGVSAEQVRALSAAGSAMGLALDVRHVSLSYRGLPYDCHGSPAVYYRLLIGEMLPEFSSVLYVDSDTIFLRDPAEQLALDFDPYPIAAVQDLCVPTLGSPDCLPGYELTSAERELPYFNSGLMVVDLDRWRHMGIGPAAVRFATESPHHLRFWDQDALNAVVRGNWHRLDRRWNVFPLHEFWSVAPFHYHGEVHVPRSQLEQLSREAFLVHFVTRHKPWTHEFPPGRLRDLWLANDGEFMSTPGGGRA
jgi:lipopolysaccharide biosynthesis glycosyltransferase